MAPWDYKIQWRLRGDAGIAQRNVGRLLTSSSNLLGSFIIAVTENDINHLLTLKKKKIFTFLIPSCNLSVYQFTFSEANSATKL